MLEPQQKTFQRQIAYKVRIFDIINGNFIKDEFSAGYIKVNDTNISRVNVIATVVYKSKESNYVSAVVDDGTGKISLRSFENNDIFSKIDVGDTTLIIGRVREFNNEKYITPEILKKTDIKWMTVRKFELNNINVSEGIKIKNENTNPIEGTNKLNEEIYLLIKKLDNGDGVLIEDIIKNSNKNEAENMIYKLLENGDIFEIKPCRLKVLE